MNYFVVHLRLGFPGNSADKESASKKEKRIYKNLPAMQETVSIPGSKKSPGEGIGYLRWYSWSSLVAQMVKNLPAMQETWV